VSPSPGSTQSAYPVSDIAAGGWTPSTGTDLFAMVDEPNVPNDSDWINSPSTTGDLTVELRQGTTLIATRTQAAPTSYTTYIFTLTGGEVATITNWSNLAVWLSVNGTAIAKLQLGTLSTPVDASGTKLYIRMTSV